jgi:glutamate--cysteine ligase
MQTISGIHYNWSLPEVSSEQYFALIRNFRRHAFLLLYLFGASPAVCSSFVAGRQHELQPLGSGSMYMPHGTSLRMGRLGYQSDAQASLKASFNSLESYGASLQDALTRPYPPYEAIGIQGPDGEYRQLATSLLQIENEFYGTIRPKRVIHPGERPLHALRERGVEYVEVRFMDLDPFVPVGIEPPTMRFIELFLLHCLLEPSPPDTSDELQALGRNQQKAAERGREPGLLIEQGESQVPLIEQVAQVVDECQPLAEAVDAAHGGTHYAAALKRARDTLHAKDATPSARVLATMRDDFEGSYARFIRAQSQQTRNQLLALPWPAERQQHFEMLAAQSLQDQRRIEEADTMPFEAYRQAYLSERRLGL